MLCTEVFIDERIISEIYFSIFSVLGTKKRGYRWLVTVEPG